MGARVAEDGRAADSVPPSNHRQRPDPVSTINFPENMAERESVARLSCTVQHCLNCLKSHALLSCIV